MNLDWGHNQIFKNFILSALSQSIHTTELERKAQSEIISIIKQARNKALLAVNTELINLYWNIGEFINRQVANAEWGDGTINQLAELIQKEHPDLKGFNRRGLYRMKQFYETLLIPNLCHH